MFRGTDMKPFEKKVWLASPTMHGEEMPVSYRESFGRGKCTHPYGWTKNMME